MSFDVITGLSMLALLIFASLSLQNMLTLTRRIKDIRAAWMTPVAVWRIFLFLIWSSFMLAALPDAFRLLIYPTDVGMVPVWFVELMRISHVLAVVPFLAANVLLVRAGPIITHQLAREPIPVELWPNLCELVPQLKVVGGLVVACVLISVFR